MSTCTVASLIDFEAEQSPSWWKRTSQPTHSVTKMIREIAQYQTRWRKVKDTVDEKIRKKVDHYFLKKFLYHINIEEGHGCYKMDEVESCMNMDITSRRDLSEKKKETVNLLDAYYLLDEAKMVEDGDEVEKLHGLLEINLVKDVHRFILKGIELPRNSTKPGEFSNKVRATCFEGKVYEYARPEGLELKVQTLLDRHNDLITYCVKEEKHLEDQIYKMFKTCSFLLFELLDLHPFSDGNGRLCRLLCNYVLSSMTPFPTPIYNVWSESNAYDFIQALVDTRTSATRHPKSLTTMIIECNHRGWRNFFRELEKGG